MFPNVSSVFNNWTSSIQMQIISKVPVDFESDEVIKGIVSFEAVIQAMSPREVQRKPEGERAWKWWKMWATTHIQSDTVIQDPNGVQFRVTNTQDWSQGGFFTSDIVEQPVGLGQS